MGMNKNSNEVSETSGGSGGGGVDNKNIKSLQLD